MVRSRRFRLAVIVLVLLIAFAGWLAWYHLFREARTVYDGRGRLAFPGVVDAHTHAGIYAPLADDALRESRAAISGGVTTMLTYFRTGQYYLNRRGQLDRVLPRGAPAVSRALLV